MRVFVRVNKVRRGTRSYQYLQILESVREDGKNKHRLIANLGRLDQLGDRVDALAQALSRFGSQRMVAPSHIQLEDALVWGPVLLARHLYERLGLPAIIQQACTGNRREFDVAETALVLLAHRLDDPGSEHGLARWLEHTYVCDDDGRRWEPQWNEAEAITSKQRVRVQAKQLNVWYRTLDALLTGQKEIEQALFQKVRDLFHLQVDLVLYDVTRVHFARRAPKEELRRHGYTRSGDPRQVRVVLGVVMANGFPLAHHVFSGNTMDHKTVQDVIGDVEERFGLKRVLVVGDRGMLSEENRQWLTADGREVRYLMGIAGRQNDEGLQVLQRIDPQHWQAVDERNQVQEVRLPDEEARFFVVHSAQREAYEQQLRQKSMERVLAELQRLQRRVQAGQLKDRDTMVAQATRILSRNHGHRYYRFAIQDDGAFHFEEDVSKEKWHEGRYLLKSNDETLTPTQAVHIYKQLSDLESGFRDLKDVIELRPIYHKTDDRVRAHIFVATLALFIKRTLEQLLRAQNLYFTPTEAFAAMKSVGVSVLNLEADSHRPDRRLLVSSGGRDARRIMQALGITHPAPPSAPLAP